MVGIGVHFFLRSKSGGEKGYFLGGRQMGPWVSALSAGASGSRGSKAMKRLWKASAAVPQKMVPQKGEPAMNSKIPQPPVSTTMRTRIHNGR